MKVYSVIRTTYLPTLEVQVENQWLPVGAFIGANGPFSIALAQVDLTDCGFYLKIENVIQGLRYNDGVGLVTLDYTTIDNDRTVIVTEFSNQIINIFNAGVNYVIPYSAGNVLPISFPDGVNAINASSYFYPATSYVYFSPSQQSILGATSISNVWTYRINHEASAQMAQEKANKSAQNLVSYANSLTR